MWPQVKHNHGHHSLSNDGMLGNEQCLFSQNGHFFLKCQGNLNEIIISGDGKIALYRAQQPGQENPCTFYWQNTVQQNGQGPFSLKVQNDGNLCLYNGGNQSIWSSNTWQQQPHAPYHLVVQHDGNVTYSDNNGHVLWEAKKQQGYLAQAPARHHVLEQGFSLLNEQQFFSPNGTYFAKCQSDGKFAVYHVNQQFNPQNAQFCWQSSAQTSNNGPFTVKMQTDANLVLYDKDNKPVWDTKKNTQQPQGPYSLHMQDDGNLVVYNGQNQAIWACK